MKFTVEQRVFLIESYLLKKKNCQDSILRYIRKYPGTQIPTESDISKLYKQWRSLGTVGDDAREIKAKLASKSKRSKKIRRKKKTRARKTSASESGVDESEDLPIPKITLCEPSGVESSSVPFPTSSIKSEQLSEDNSSEESYTDDPLAAMRDDIVRPELISSEEESSSSEDEHDTESNGDELITPDPLPAASVISDVIIKTEFQSSKPKWSSLEELDPIDIKTEINIKQEDSFI